MPKYKRRGPPKHLEKMLFINHKEDVMLDDRLHQLNLQSRYKLMELDRERIKVRNELRNSQKKQITINEAISTGLVPQDDAFFHSGRKGPNINCLLSASPKGGDNSQRPSKTSTAERRASAPPQRKNAVVQRPAMPRSTSFVQGSQGKSRISISNQFSRQPAIPEHEEYDANKNERESFVLRQESIDTVGSYVLGEFEKISQVVPDILRALAKKKEKQQEADELARLKEMKNDIAVDLDNIMEYEPDMNKVRKTVRAVKKLRHRMAISKRLENSKTHKPLDQMIKDKTETIGDNDEFTDGTCALMKRRVEKKRRESAPFALDPRFMQRHGNVGGGGDISAMTRRPSIAPEALLRRASSMSALPAAITRSSTMMNMGSVSRLNAMGANADGDGSPFIDEDVLMNRQRVMREVDKYRTLQNRVDRFIISTIPYRINNVFEEIIPIT